MSTLDIVRWIAVLAAAYLTIGMGWALLLPGSSLSRAIVAALVVALGWIGAAGAVARRFRLVLSGAAGLILLGFWQAVLWIFMLPTAAILLVVGLLMWRSGDVRVRA